MSSIGKLPERPDYYITLPIYLPPSDESIPKYFKDRDITRLDHQGLHDFLNFYIEQRRLQEKEAERPLRDQEIDSRLPFLDNVSPRSYSDYCQDQLDGLTITDQILRLYRSKISNILERWLPKSSPIQITSPEQLDRRDIVDDFAYNPSPDDDDITKFLIMHDFGHIEDPETPAEEKYYQEGDDLVCQLSSEDLDKYRQMITRTVMYNLSEATCDDLDEYFILQQGLTDEAIITHQLFVDFLIWFGWDPNEIAEFDIKLEDIYGSLREIKFCDPEYQHQQEIKAFQERRGAKIIQRAWTKYWYHPNETGESRYAKYMAFQDLSAN